MIGLLNRILRPTIRAKFTFASTLIAALSIVFAAGTYIYFYADSARRALDRELAAVAAVIGSNTVAALVFDDPPAATEVLQALRSKPDIVSASIFRRDGSLFASYSSNKGRGRSPGTSSDDLVFVEKSIDHNGEQVGAIRIIASLAEVRSQQVEFMWLAVGVAVGAAFLAFLLSTLIQRAMLRPILHLVSTMRRVSEKRDYSLRATGSTSDELGRLVAGFNEMLRQIEAQHTELEGYRRDLEGLVERRTRELSRSNDQLKETILELREAKAKVEASSKAKSEFLANMSHELRTPLNAVIGFSELMKAETFGPLGARQYREYAGDICASGQHLLAVIGDILDMTRIEVGKFSLNESTTSVGALLMEAYRLIRPSADKKNLRFAEPVSDCADLRLRCDPTRVRQVLLNLLANAVKFTAPGGEVSLMASAMAESVVFDITDTGIGIREGDFEHILEPFGQVETAYSRNHDGIGLGLSLSRALMRAHGGDLVIESAPGRGTTVSVLLPLDRVVQTHGDQTHGDAGGSVRR